MDTQVTFGAIVTGLLIGWVAYEHGLFAWIARNFRARPWPVPPVRVSLAKNWRWQ